MKLKEQNINNELFKSSSNMYEKLSKTEGAVNDVRVDSFKKVLNKLQRTIDYVPNDNAFKIDENEKIIDIVESILEFNNKFQFSRLPISLAQLNARNNSEKLKN